MDPILINKDVFEPSYNDLKYMAWNHNYVCTNLIYLIWVGKWMIKIIRGSFFFWRGYLTS